MEIEYTCPLGSKCEEAKDGKLHRCRWFVKLRGKDPQSSQEFDEYRCSMEWAPILMVEHSLFEKQTGAAVENFRNVMVAQNSQLLGMAARQAMSEDNKPKLVNKK